MTNWEDILIHDLRIQFDNDMCLNLLDMLHRWNKSNQQQHVYRIWLQKNNGWFYSSTEDEQRRKTYCHYNQIHQISSSIGIYFVYIYHPFVNTNHVHHNELYWQRNRSLSLQINDPALPMLQSWPRKFSEQTQWRFSHLPPLWQVKSFPPKEKYIW